MFKIFEELKNELLFKENSFLWLEKKVQTLYSSKTVVMKIETFVPMDVFKDTVFTPNYPPVKSDEVQMSFRFPIEITFGEEKFVFAARQKLSPNVFTGRMERFISFENETVEILSHFYNNLSHYKANCHILKMPIPTNMAEQENQVYHTAPVASAFYHLVNFLEENGFIEKPKAPVFIYSKPLSEHWVTERRYPKKGIKVSSFKRIFSKEFDIGQDCLPWEDELKVQFTEKSRKWYFELFDERKGKVVSRVPKDCCALIVFNTRKKQEQIYPFERFLSECTTN